MSIELHCLDADQAEPIAKALLDKEPNGKFSRVLDRDSARDSVCVLIMLNGDFIGFATINADGNMCEIYRFFIEPAHRDSTHGTVAAREIEKLLRGDEYHRCYLQIDDERTFRFWKRALGDLMVGNESANMYYKDL